MKKGCYPQVKDVVLKGLKKGNVGLNKAQKNTQLDELILKTMYWGVRDKYMKTMIKKSLFERMTWIGQMIKESLQSREVNYYGSHASIFLLLSIPKIPSHCQTDFQFNFGENK